MLVREFITCSAIALGLVITHPSWASMPRVSVHVQACVGIDAEEVERLAAIELSAYLVEESQATEDVTRVTVDCHNPAVELRVTDPVSGKLLSRSVDLTPVDRKARARVLALAVAELVSSSWMEVEHHPEPVIVPREAVAPPEERAAAREAARESVQPASYALFAGGGFRWFTGGVGPLFGAGMRLAYRRASGGVLGTFDVMRGSQSISAGELQITTASGSLAYARYLRTRNWTLSTSAGARLGWGLLEGRPEPGQPYDAERFGGVFGGPLLRLGADYTAPTGFSVGAGLEGGAVATGLGARVDGTRETTLSGAWVGATLGLGLSR